MPSSLHQCVLQRFLIVCIILYCSACDPFQATEQLSVEQTYQRILTDDDIILLDVRSEEEFAAGHLPDAINVPIYKFTSGLPELSFSKDDDIIVYCKSGPRAYFVQKVLQQAGYIHIYDMRGHYSEWEKKDFPIQG